MRLGPGSPGQPCAQGRRSARRLSHPPARPRPVSTRARPAGALVASALLGPAQESGTAGSASPRPARCSARCHRCPPARARRRASAHVQPQTPGRDGKGQETPGRKDETGKPGQCPGGDRRPCAHRGAARPGPPRRARVLSPPRRPQVCTGRQHTSSPHRASGVALQSTLRCLNAWRDRPGAALGAVGHMAGAEGHMAGAVGSGRCCGHAGEQSSAGSGAGKPCRPLAALGPLGRRDRSGELRGAAISTEASPFERGPLSVPNLQRRPRRPLKHGLGVPPRGAQPQHPVT